MYFEYNDKEIQYLKEKDKKLGAVINQIGHIYREVDDRLYTSLIHHIIGQQISTKAHMTVWKRMLEKYHQVTPQTLKSVTRDELQQLGMTFRKADYILDLTAKVNNGEIDLENLDNQTDENIMKILSSLNGIGEWTVEMIMIFCMQRPHVFSYGDMAIHRGLRMIYHHRCISKKQFEIYRHRFHPYESIASLYIWAVAGGAIEGMKDYPLLKKKVRRK